MNGCELEFSCIFYSMIGQAFQKKTGHAKKYPTRFGRSMIHFYHVKC